MAYKLEVKHPDYPPEADMEFDCDGIMVKNGESVTVTEEMERAFYARNGRPIKDIYGHGTIAKLTGSSALSAKENAEMKSASAPAESEPEPEVTEEVNA